MCQTRFASPQGKKSEYNNTPKKSDKPIFKSPKIEKNDHFEKSNFIFKTVSRDKQSKILNPKVETPAVGFYHPKYDIFSVKKGTDLNFSRQRHSLQPSIKNENKLPAPKQDSKCLEVSKLKNRLDKLIRSSHKTKNLAGVKVNLDFSNCKRQFLISHLYLSLVVAIYSSVHAILIV